MRRKLVLLLCLLLPAVLPAASFAEPLRVPAYLAYAEPNPEGFDISEENGVQGWKDGHQRAVWYGTIVHPGALKVSLELNMPEKAVSRLRLRVGRQTRTFAVSGDATTTTTQEFTVAKPGRCRIALEGVKRSGPEFVGKISNLVLDGPAADGAKFNRIPVQRGAPSVHLHYPVAEGTKVAWFYNTITVGETPLWSYYMACGWHRGYFGIQVNSPTERRIIFSVWDSGAEPTDRGKVRDEDKVKLLAKGDGVFADSFGNEGTGGHSHLVYPWKKGRTYRFLVTAEPQGTATIYSGYFFFPEKRRWGLIASFRAPKDGNYMRRLYSFNEDFGPANGQMKRAAVFGPAWIEADGGEWQELTTARFTHTGADVRADFAAYPRKGGFALECGGFVESNLKFGDVIERKPTGSKPAPILLPQP